VSITTCERSGLRAGGNGRPPRWVFS